MASANSTKLGNLLDKLWEKRKEVLSAKAKAKKLDKEYNELEKQVFADFKKSDIEGAFGKFCRVKINRREVPTLKDPKAFFNFVARNRAFELLQHRVSRAAWLERMEAGKKVPGVEPFDVMKLSLTKKK